MLEAQLTQYGNTDMIQINFNRPFCGRAIRKYGMDEKPLPKRLRALKNKLDYVGLGATIEFGTADLRIDCNSAPWSFFLPAVVKALRAYWREDFQLVYNDERPLKEYDYDDEGWTKPGSGRRVTRPRIDYGIKLIGQPEA